jgi:hypothetical protein
LEASQALQVAQVVRPALVAWQAYRVEQEVLLALVA